MDVPSSPGRTRTYNPSVNSRMLCRLSYRGRVTRGVYDFGCRASRFFEGEVARLYGSLIEVFNLRVQPVLLVEVVG